MRSQKKKKKKGSATGMVHPDHNVMTLGSPQEGDMVNPLRESTGPLAPSRAAAGAAREAEAEAEVESEGREDAMAPPEMDLGHVDWSKPQWDDISDEVRPPLWRRRL